jgi:hypothetical protein
MEFHWSLSKYFPWWWPRRTQTCCIRNKKTPLSIYNKVGTDSERGGYSFNIRYYSVIHLRKSTENLSMMHYSLKRLNRSIKCYLYVNMSEVYLENTSFLSHYITLSGLCHQNTHSSLTIMESHNDWGLFRKFLIWLEEQILWRMWHWNDSTLVGLSIFINSKFKFSETKPKGKTATQ